MKKALIFVAATVAATPLAAEVCDRDDFPLQDAIEGEIDENGFELRYESGTYRTQTGWARIYCVRNVAERQYAYVRWKGPDPSYLFKEDVAAGDYLVVEGSSSPERPQPDGRTFEYGHSKRPEFSKDVRSMVIGSGPERLQFAQADLLDQFGGDFDDVIGDPEVLDTYLSTVQETVGEAVEVVVSGFADIIVPADPEILKQVAAGEAIEYDGPMTPISYFYAASINTESRVVTARVGISSIPQQDPRLVPVQSAPILDDLSLVWGPGTAEEEVEFNEIVSASDVRDGLSTAGFVGDVLGTFELDRQTSLELQPWVVGLAFQGEVISTILVKQFNP